MSFFDSPDYALERKIDTIKWAANLLKQTPAIDFETDNIFTKMMYVKAQIHFIEWFDPLMPDGNNKVTHT